MKFKNGFCTNTRLMGNTMLAVEWIDDEGLITSHVFMLDSEGLGITDLYILKTKNDDERFALYINKSGCLGGSNLGLNEKEVAFMVNHFHDKNIRNEKPTPDSFTDELKKFYSDLDYSGISLDDMLYKTCKKMESEYEFVNYMVMRFIARDREALLFYSGSEEVSTHHITKINGALLYNEIEKKKDDRFVCNCVYEDIDGYFEAKIIVNIDHENYRLRSILIVDVNRIYDNEVFYIISKREFVDIYSYSKSLDKAEIENMIFGLYPSIQKYEYDCGELYTQYYLDNSHVDTDVYVINNDIMLIIYITDNQIFLGTYDEEIRFYVDKILSTYFTIDIQKEDSIEFEQNVLFDFVESGNVDFYDFID